MRPEDAVRIRHMIDAAEVARSFIDGRQRSSLNEDRMLLFALVRAVEIIGEAASRVTLETRCAAPAVPWIAIIGMRNRLVHAYFDIDRDILWKTVTEEIPDLIPLLAAGLPEAENES
jgi:uncharacterized protein with HEPN domain